MTILSKLNTLDKIDKLRDIAKGIKPAIIGILEFKVPSIVLDLEIRIENKEILYIH